MIATMSVQKMYSSSCVTICTTPFCCFSIGEKQGRHPSAVGGVPSWPLGHGYLSIFCHYMQDTLLLPGRIAPAGDLFYSLFRICRISKGDSSGLA